MSGSEGCLSSLFFFLYLVLFFLSFFPSSFLFAFFGFFVLFRHEGDRQVGNDVASEGLD